MAEDADLGVACTVCGFGGVKAEFRYIKEGSSSGSSYRCPVCFERHGSSGSIGYNRAFDNKPSGRPKPKDMRVRTWEEKEAELEQTRRAVAKAMGWEA